MKKGGYQIIDLENLPFNDGGTKTIKGIYDLIEGTRKPIYVSGLVIDGIEYHDKYVDVYVDGSDYVLSYREKSSEGCDITVTADDEVTVQKIQQGGN